MVEGAHVLETVAVGLLDHLPDGRIGRRDGGVPLPNVDALGAQALLRHVVGAVRAALDLDGHDRLSAAVERFVADEHGGIRSHGVSHHVGDLQGAPVGVFDAQYGAVVADAHVDRSAVAVRKGDNLLLDAVLRNGLQLDCLCFLEFHAARLPILFYPYSNHFINHGG